MHLKVYYSAPYKIESVQYYTINSIIEIVML